MNEPSFARMYLIACVLSLAIFGTGLYLAVGGENGTSVAAAGTALLAAGSVSLVGVLVAWPLALMLSAQLKNHHALSELFADRLQQLSIMLNMISEQQLLSDRAKSVAFREKDRDALRRAIRDEMTNKDWEAALVLVSDMESTFGYRQEADRFRDEVQRLREEDRQRQITETAGVIDRHCRGELWDAALQEAQKLISLFPGNAQVQQLPQEIDTRRLNHKKQLLESWNDAVARHDNDGSIEILRKLDPYLTPDEAEAMKETARNVFKEKLHNLRTQFSLAVQDHRWAEAIRVGEQIMNEFPNSRISQEVREKMDALRQRATEPEKAEV